MKTIQWGFLIVNYLFLGGLSAGLYFVSALATFLYRIEEPSPYTRIARMGAFLAPWPVMVGCGLLIFDLGRWYHFYKLFLHLRLASPMSIGTWLLVFFNLIALINCYAWLTAAQRDRLFQLVPKFLGFLKKLNYDIDHWRRYLAFLGLPLSIGVGIYTGVLLGAVQSRPFWNTNLVAQMFLFSALSTGCAVLIAVLCASPKAIGPQQLRFLYTLDVCLILLELFIVLPYIIHGELSVRAVRESLELILGGPYTLVFWALFMALGLLAPLAIEILELAPSVLSGAPVHYRRRLAAITAGLVIVGGYTLRYVFVYAGQASSFR